MSSPILEVRGVSKTFGNVKALDSVDFFLQKGIVHGLLGENGAGKSSLMNVLSGIYLPESGTIKIKNQNVQKLNPPYAPNKQNVLRGFSNISGLLPKISMLTLDIVVGMPRLSSCTLSIGRGPKCQRGRNQPTHPPFASSDFESMATECLPLKTQILQS